MTRDVFFSFTEVPMKHFSVPLILLTLFALAVCGFGARAVTWTQPTPPVTHVSKGTNATSNGQITAALAAVSGKVNYIEGFDVTYSGATSATNFAVTVTGTTNTLYFSNVVLAGANAAGNAQGGIFIRFPSPIPASASNTAITVTVPDLGSGNANVSANVYGFYQ
jgi:hypothetical protein